MITAVHLLLYADDPEAARAFFRDVLDLPNVDAGGGWLIFKTPPAELAVHPAGGGEESSSTPQHHEVTLMCDDIESTVAELTAKGAQFSRGIRDDRWGLTTGLKVPGAGEVLLYEPRHPVAHAL
jgi:predicted enzyme related to lactoylglutathione lyase